jgi:hypothetical protein
MPVVVVLALRAKALPDHVGAGDSGAHGRRFSSLGALWRSLVHSIACGLILRVKTQIWLLEPNRTVTTLLMSLPSWRRCSWRLDTQLEREPTAS